MWWENVIKQSTETHSADGERLKTKGVLLNPIKEGSWDKQLLLFFIFEINN